MPHDDGGWAAFEGAVAPGARADAPAPAAAPAAPEEPWDAFQVSSRCLYGCHSPIEPLSIATESRERSRLALPASLVECCWDARASCGLAERPAELLSQDGDRRHAEAWQIHDHIYGSVQGVAAVIGCFCAGRCGRLVSSGRCCRLSREFLIAGLPVVAEAGCQLRLPDPNPTLGIAHYVPCCWEADVAVLDRRRAALGRRRRGPPPRPRRRPPRTPSAAHLRASARQRRHRSRAELRPRLQRSPPTRSCGCLTHRWAAARAAAQGRVPPGLKGEVCWVLLGY